MIKTNLYKFSETHQTASFVILVPDMVDRNGDIITKDEIIKTAHEFFINISEKKIDVNHEQDTDLPDNVYKFVESYITPSDIITDWWIIPTWSWIVGIKFFDNDLWEKVKSWEISGVSMDWEWMY